MRGIAVLGTFGSETAEAVLTHTVSLMRRSAEFVIGLFGGIPAAQGAREVREFNTFGLGSATFSPKPGEYSRARLGLKLLPRARRRIRAGAQNSLGLSSGFIVSLQGEKPAKVHIGHVWI